MGSVFYLTVEPSSRTTKFSRRLHGSSAESYSSDLVVELRRNRCPHGGIATCWELLFAFYCSLICSAYTLRYEDRNTILPDSVPQVQLPDPGDGLSSLILDPPPTLMLGACLLLGCSVSSFIYRRQEEDRYQKLIFSVTLTAATLFGMAQKVNANLIMLGLIPWGLCLAMIFSVATHWLVKRCSKRGAYSRVGCCESGEKGMHAPL
ncbi:uncharacterized protein LY89DRAFT_498857 [Mollisia scopiformis]|uniref:Uncharacterized protein n=1 Tax=Mollisia scopiformis TaxID=149040 RepID=A0A194XEH8_MOLSC|nr:uncharacterized protein LY89DRAFT_498857 [Mollisia scopiformis]KUJ18551.1 hypothetical protein LY89DRAFT_498857 [Mollisia scopiformis]